MAEPFIAEIRIFPFNFAPQGWAFCDGQLLPIAQNTALFSLVGTFYGGDGETTFGLPNLQGRLPMHPGHGPGLSARSLGQSGGVETVTLNTSQVPAHSHSVKASTNPGDLDAPNANRGLARSSGGFAYTGEANMVDLASPVSTQGGGQAHNNLMPSLTLNYCIALVGVFPSRS